MGWDGREEERKRKRIEGIKGDRYLIACWFSRHEAAGQELFCRCECVYMSHIDYDWYYCSKRIRSSSIYPDVTDRDMAIDGLIVALPIQVVVPEK